MSTRRLGTHTRKFAPSGLHGKANHTRDVRMYEDFGFLKGTAFDFSKEWEDQAVLSEANTEKELNKDGLRYRMAPTEKEKMETGRTGGPDGPTFGKHWVSLPAWTLLIGMANEC